MIGHVGVHRANDAQVVNVRLGRAGEELAHLDAALAVLLERERRAQGRTGFALGAKSRPGKRLAVVLRQHRLGVERIDVRRAAIHEQMDDLFGPRGEMRRLGRQRPERSEQSVTQREPCELSPSTVVVGDDARQADQAKPHAATPEQLAAVEQKESNRLIRTSCAT